MSSLRKPRLQCLGTWLRPSPTCTNAESCVRDPHGSIRRPRHPHSVPPAHRAATLADRDVKSDNVLLAASGRAVVSDFNAAVWEAHVTSDIVMQSRPTGGFFKQFVVGTLPYMAPELLRSVRGAAYARACDVYSFGITANEVLTQTVPYSDAMPVKSETAVSTESSKSSCERYQGQGSPTARMAPPQQTRSSLPGHRDPL